MLPLPLIWVLVGPNTVKQALDCGRGEWLGCPILRGAWSGCCGTKNGCCGSHWAPGTTTASLGKEDFHSLSQVRETKEIACSSSGTGTEWDMGFRIRWSWDLVELPCFRPTRHSPHPLPALEHLLPASPILTVNFSSNQKFGQPPGGRQPASDAGPVAAPYTWHALWHVCDGACEAQDMVLNPFASPWS